MVPTRDPKLVKEERDKAAALAKMKAEKKELALKATNELISKRAKAKEKADKIRRNEKAKKAAVQAAEKKMKAELMNNVGVSIQNWRKLKAIAVAKKLALDASQKIVAESEKVPSNIAMGSLPDHDAFKGEMRIQNSPAHQQRGYIQFPTTTLKPDDVIVEARIKLYKFGGIDGPAVIKIATCGWDRDTLTFTKAQDLGGATLSEGDDAKFPTGKKWLEIKLDATHIQAARLAGDTICLEVGGGPADSAIILGSELSANRPTLVVEVKRNLPRKKGEPVQAKPNSEAAKKAYDRFKADQVKSISTKFSQQFVVANKATLQKENEAAAIACSTDIKEKTSGTAKAAIAAKEDISTSSEEKKETDKFSADMKESGKTGEDLNTALTTFKLNLQTKLKSKAKSAVAKTLADIEASVTQTCEREKTKRELKYGELAPAQEKKVQNYVSETLPGALAKYNQKQGRTTAGGKADAKTEEKTEEKAEAKTEEKTEEKAEAKTEEKTEAKPDKRLMEARSTSGPQMLNDHAFRDSLQLVQLLDNGY